MKCKDCQHFKILYGHIGKAPDIWDFGRAKCEKYDAYVDFANKRKLNKMECIEKSEIWGGISAERHRMDDLISRKAVAEKMKNRRDYVGRPSDPDCIIADEPSVPAVPLDKLCEWLAERYEPPYSLIDLDKLKAPIDFRQQKEIWMVALTKWMEEQENAT